MGYLIFPANLDIMVAYRYNWMEYVEMENRNETIFEKDLSIADGCSDRA
jgi:hypothetical protein